MNSIGPLFRASWTVRGKRGSVKGPIEPTAGLAAKHIPDKAMTATVLRDSQGADHPENAGKFFLHRIIK
jgi:hypothetical protein